MLPSKPPEPDPLHQSTCSSTQNSTILQSIKKSQTLALSDQQILDSGIPKNRIVQYKRLYYSLQFTIEKWYDSLQLYTFQTKFIPIQFKHAITVIQAHKHIMNTQTEKDSSNLTKFPFLSQAAFNLFSDSQLAHLEEIYQICNSHLAKHPLGLFFKLSTRSPKDVYSFAFQDNQFIQEIHQNVSKLMYHHKPFLKNQKSRKDSVIQFRNIATIAYFQASCSMSRIRDANHFMKLLLHSDRIYFDFLAHTSFGEKFFKLQYIFRQWNSQIPQALGHEFRCFCFQGNLTAITQYASFLYFPELVSLQPLLLKEISDFFQHIHPKISLDSYVFDVVYLSDGTDETVDTINGSKSRKWFLIELNPFRSGTDSGLFSWEKDLVQLTSLPTSFRIRENTDDLTPYRDLPSARWETILDSILNHQKKKNCQVF